jgi:hypothetical protein
MKVMECTNSIFGIGCVVCYNQMSTPSLLSLHDDSSVICGLHPSSLQISFDVGNKVKTKSQYC